MIQTRWRRQLALRCRVVPDTLHTDSKSWRSGRRAHRKAAGNRRRCCGASHRRWEHSQPAAVAARPPGNAAGDFGPARRNAAGSGGTDARSVPALTEVATNRRDRCNRHGGCNQASGLRRDSRPIQTFTEPCSVDPSGRRCGVHRCEHGSPGKNPCRDDGVLVMELQIGQRLELLDAQERALGQITLEERQGDLLLGSFAPGPGFAAVEPLFRRFEEAVNLQAIPAADRCEAAISALGLYLGQTGGAAKVDVTDVQIWSDGGVSCRLPDDRAGALNGDAQETQAPERVGEP